MVAWRGAISLGCSVSRLLTQHNHKYLPLYTNSSPKESPRLQLTILAFCLIFRPHFGENYCLQSEYDSASCLCQSGALICDNFWVYSISQCLGQPGLTNIKLHWYDLNHQLHLRTNTLVLLTIITDVLSEKIFFSCWKSWLFALALFTLRQVSNEL